MRSPVRPRYRPPTSSRLFTARVRFTRIISSFDTSIPKNSTHHILTFQFPTAYKSNLRFERGPTMNDDTTKDLFSRRKFLESGSAAIAAAGMLASDAAAQGEKQPY